MILVVKRSILGGLIYLLGNGLYFGYYMYTILANMNGSLSLQNSTDLIFAVIGIILPLLVVGDTVLDKNRKEHPTDKKTDWFYNNKEYERKLDERADKNQYRIS